ncbi:chromate transporter [Enhydrobacter aerosaccus]|uniref:Chromate transporter n=1 Tax=Enhydrobacter aerosaccus TaxID=225324 RepID=A0A1T4T1J1_9HYPH|nr:chromate transporter [Enhydrobacter aerosaccus]SKA34315.1 chromate transporter [Enhydrobacter aerosaccus]
MNSTLVSIALLFSQLSLLAFGGGNTILPEMHRQAVNVYHWMSDPEFAALFALAQAAPGPNMMVAPLIGWQVAGWSGLAVATLGMFGPSSIVTCVALRLWRRFKDQTWRRAIQTGLVPISIGLVAASAVLIVQASDHEWVLAAITAGCAIVAVRTRLHPLWLLAAGAAVGWTGLGQ